MEMGTSSFGSRWCLRSKVALTWAKSSEGNSMSYRCVSTETMGAFDEVRGFEAGQPAELGWYWAAGLVKIRSVRSKPSQDMGESTRGRPPPIGLPR